MNIVQRLFLLPLCAISCLGAAQAPGPTFLVLGSYHMANNSGHLVTSHQDDHGSPARQQQIAAVVEGLKAYRPTRIAVEQPLNDPKLKAAFDGYLAGKHELAINEVEQFGFRLAKLLGINDLRGFDSPMPMKGAEEAIASIEGQRPARLAAAFKEDVQWLTDFQERIGHGTVKEQLLELNGPVFTRHNEGCFMHMLQAGSDLDPLGVAPMAAWHERNLRMAAALLRAANPGDRVLVIVGASHLKLLREFLGNTPGVKLEDPISYLQ